MGTSSPDRYDATPHDAALRISSHLSSQGAADVTIWDGSRLNEDLLDRDPERTPCLECAAVLASAWPDWDVELSFTFAAQFPGLLLEPVRYGVLAIYKDDSTPLVIPPDWT